MKQKLFIILGLALLLLVIAYIAYDLFNDKKDAGKNPYEYDLQALKNPDSIHAAYNEVLAFKPQMDEIHGVAVDSYDRIFVAGKGFLEIYTESGNLLKRISIDGTALCINIDPDKNIFLGMEDHIEVRRMDGKLEGKWAAKNQASIITSISSNGKDVFAADAGMTSVYHYNISGKFIGHIGDKEPQKGIPGFVVPSPYFDLGISENNELWVANPGRHVLQKFDFEGKLLCGWGVASMAIDGFCGCCNPSNFARLKDGSFVTSEKGIERVKVYSKDGKFRCAVALPNAFTEGTRGLDLAVDSRDRIVLLDPERKMIRVFVSKTETQSN